MDRQAGRREFDKPDREFPNGVRNPGTETDWERPVDRSLLEAFRRDGPESRPLVAARLGVHLKYAEKRCVELESRGYLFSRDGRFYEVTERGETYLDGAEPVG